MVTQKMDTEVRREQIGQAALRLIASQGMSAMTVERIAKMVGLVPSAIYRHFKSKGNILDAVLDLLRNRLNENVRIVRAETEEPLECLRRLLMRQVALIMEYQAIPRILFSEEVYSRSRERKGKLHETICSFLSGIEEVIRQGQEKGQIRTDIQAGTLAVMFLGLFQPSSFLWHLSNGEFDMVRQVDFSWKVYSDAIRIQ